METHLWNGEERIGMQVAGYPKVMRVFDIIVGVILFIVGFWTILFITTPDPLIILFYVFALGSMGLTRLGKAERVKSLPRSIRILNMIVGLILILLSVVILFLPDLPLLLQIRLLMVGPLLVGGLRIYKGLIGLDIPFWAKVIHELVGISMAAIGVVVLLVPALAFELVVYLFSGSLLINSILRILNGATGKLR